MEHKHHPVVISVVVIVVLIVAAVAIFLTPPGQLGEVDVIDEEFVDEGTVYSSSNESQIDYEPNLSDVTLGEIIYGVSTKNEATGEVSNAYDNSEGGTGFLLEAQFMNLPDPGPGYFYEGWIVRKGENRSVISTGKAEPVVRDGAVVPGEYVNEFSSDEDLRDHNFYVLTIELDDGDPSPDRHILEGDIN